MPPGGLAPGRLPGRVHPARRGCPFVAPPAVRSR
ncbi:Hypothetical Protein RRSL_01998 [Ralstonia solanacearum UW551]|uniref:Uncharacterized protein n=1 Tax=Ralstonia solanacearum (strain UW551) TaxID=342110 RepID=A0AB33VCE3_RALSU|nr:Hypothetical Protein RRSL_01998 [Ralstonia solanacearum UW551]